VDGLHVRKRFQSSRRVTQAGSSSYSDRNGRRCPCAQEHPCPKQRTQQSPIQARHDTLDGRPKPPSDDELLLVKIRPPLGAGAHKKRLAALARRDAL
jgi:hypothetical protein